VFALQVNVTAMNVSEGKREKAWYAILILTGLASTSNLKNSNVVGIK